MFINTDMQENLSLESVPPSSIPVLLHVFVGNSDNDIGSKLDSCTDDKKKKKSCMRYPVCGVRKFKSKKPNKIKKRNLNDSNKELNGNTLSLRNVCNLSLGWLRVWALESGRSRYEFHILLNFLLL